MGFAIFLLIVMIVIQIIPSAALGPFKPFRRPTQIGIGFLMLFTVGFTAFKYNDAGYCQHVRTIFGTETNKCDLGWYFAGWGSATEWPHYITIAHTMDANADGSSISGPYMVRMADN